MLAVSEPVAPGAVAVIFALLPSADVGVNLKPVSVWRDPPTAAAFDVRRIDVLTVGETLDEIGHLAGSVRLVVYNRSPHIARFRAQIDLEPDLSRMEHELGNIVDAAWRAGRDGSHSNG
jgi:hypothetical protein